MTVNFDQPSVQLDRALFMRIVDAAGTIVTCLDGSLWVTRDGCFEDIVLEPGHSYRVEDATQVIVSGFGPSLARVSQPAVERQHQPARNRDACLMTAVTTYR